MKLSSLLSMFQPEEKLSIPLSSNPLLARMQQKKIHNRRTSMPACFAAKKAIFIHIPKTAGQSICKNLFHVKSVGHMPYVWYQGIAPEQCLEYFKFAIVRNPWDRVVSAYHYLLRGGAIKRDSGLSEIIRKYEGFDDFVRKWMCKENIENHIHFIPQCYFIENQHGVIDIDYIGRFETLQSDINEIVGSNKGFLLPVILEEINSSSRGNYKDYYSPESKKIVEALYSRDINEFGYYF
ncbi:MAG: sulfotransferase family 2 domain-containing protein [Porticoccus sp.]